MSGSPAHAGIDPRGIHARRRLARFPRPRGDRPEYYGANPDGTGGFPHPGRDPVPDLLQAPPGVPKAGQGESCPEKGAGLRSNPHLLTTTPVTGRGASSRPVTGADRDVLCVEGLKEGTRKKGNA